jgi:hypothetical protein
MEFNPGHNGVLSIAYNTETPSFDTTPAQRSGRQIKVYIGEDTFGN